MNASDEIRLRHMLDAAETALRLAQGRTRRNLDEDEGLALSLTKAVEPLLQHDAEQSRQPLTEQ